ncbi:MAG: hypothetical protein RSE13_09760 [Planktothrix sp. GU0601_MAG3]|nr:MAG: hypothetical protein RSE13_09760 [Planktothrix sp. GU0601_MAG3]
MIRNPNLLGDLGLQLAKETEDEEGLTASKLKAIIENVLKKSGLESFNVTTDITEDDVAIQLDLSKQQEYRIPLASDFGIPALGIGFDSQGSLNANLNFDVSLAFGLHKQFGFYIDTKKTKLDTGIKVDLDQFKGKGNLGFLQLDFANDEKNPTKLEVRFSANLNDIDDIDNKKAAKTVQLRSIANLEDETDVIDVNVTPVEDEDEISSINPDSELAEDIREILNELTQQQSSVDKKQVIADTIAAENQAVKDAEQKNDSDQGIDGKDSIEEEESDKVAAAKESVEKEESDSEVAEKEAVDEAKSNKVIAQKDSIEEEESEKVTATKESVEKEESDSEVAATKESVEKEESDSEVAATKESVEKEESENIVAEKNPTQEEKSEEDAAAKQPLNKDSDLPETTEINEEISNKVASDKSLASPQLREANPDEEILSGEALTQRLIALGIGAVNEILPSGQVALTNSASEIKLLYEGTANLTDWIKIQGLPALALNQPTLTYNKEEKTYSFTSNITINGKSFSLGGFSATKDR